MSKKSKQPNAVYPIPESLADQYHGAGEGYALIDGDIVVRIIYAQDYNGLSDAEADLDWHYGMISCWEFVE